MIQTLKIIPVLIILVGLVLGYISTTGTKSQWIRLIDIFVIGPLMIWLGYQTYTAAALTTDQQQITTNTTTFYRDTHIAAACLLIFFGATTMTYNLRNYLHQRR